MEMRPSRNKFRNLANADLGLLRQLSNRGAAIFTKEIRAKYIFLVDIPNALGTDFSEVFGEQLAAARAVV